jgi:ABC-2 type transport system permease protein
MRGFAKLVLTNFKLYMREPISVFFTLAFAPMLVFIFGSIYGNEPSAYFNGHGSMDVTIPAYIALIIGSVGIMSISINICSQRESGTLRRFQASPLHPLAYILADVLSNLIVTMLGLICLLLVGFLVYHVRMMGSIIDVALAILLGCLSMFSLGYLIASLMPTARSGQIMGMAIFYPMMFLSGAGMPIEIMGSTMQKVARFLPLSYVVTLIKGMWFGEPWSAHWLDVLILVGIMIVCLAAASRLFKWK